MSPPLLQAFLEAPLAHRALHDVSAGRPENSRAAIRAAIDAGYGIEIDVQLSGDGEALVFHDYELARLAEGRGSLRSQPLAALSRTKLKGGDGEGIPSLAEVTDLVSGKVPLLVELKDQDGQMGADTGSLERAASSVLRAYRGPLAVMSFNPHSVACLADLLPDVPRGLVTGAWDSAEWDLPEDILASLRDIPAYEYAQCSFISHEWQDLSRPRVQQLKSQGAGILCWTVTTPGEEAVARTVADNITFEHYAAPFVS